MSAHRLSRAARRLAAAVVLLLAACSTGPDPSVVASPSSSPSASTASTAPAGAASAPQPGGPARLATFDPVLAPEVSGLAVSRRDPDVLYLVDDGPGTTGVLALGS